MADADLTWDGERGRYWASHAEWFTRMLSDFGEAVVEAGALTPGERVLAVGCGNGDLTVAVAQAVAPGGSVLGIDLSAEELEVATVRASRHDLTNVELRQADASADDLGDQPCDVLVSRFGVMFFADPVAAFGHLHGAMADDGRVAFACWQGLDQNPWIRRHQEAVATVAPVPTPPPGAPGPFGLAEADHTRGILTRAGFSDVGFAPIERPVHFGADLDDAVEFLASMEWTKVALRDVDDAQRDAALAAIRDELADQALPDGRLELPAAAWVVTARA
jgi:SAM-dependent methyltransferase